MVEAIRKSTFPKVSGGQTETTNDCAIIKTETFQPSRHAERLCNALGTTHANAVRTSGEFAPVTSATVARIFCQSLRQVRVRPANSS